MDAIQSAFVEEIRKQQQAMKEHLLRIKSGGGDTETIAAVFRAVHGIFCAAHRANGDTCNNKYRFVIEFTQGLYDMLDEMRSESIMPDTTLLELLFACTAHLGALMGCVKNDTAPTDDINGISQSLRVALKRIALPPGA